MSHHLIHFEDVLIYRNPDAVVFESRSVFPGFILLLLFTYKMVLYFYVLK